MNLTILRAMARMARHAAVPAALAVSVGRLVEAQAADAAKASVPTVTAEATLPTVTVEAVRTTAQQQQLPVTTESVTAEKMAEGINVVNTEDALKYLPGLIVRKRNFGDQQAPLATRTSGLGQSARSLIYADGVLLSAPIGNNNSSASPRWALVAPEEIERIDVLYGPFSAAYPGNSMGAVVNLVTRMPERFEGAVKAQTSWQRFSLYGTDDTYGASQLSATLGSRAGPWSWWLSANRLEAHTQPVAIITALRPAAPSGAGTPVTGAWMDSNRLGQPIAVIGAGGLESKTQDNLKARVALDLTRDWRLAYSIGYFRNAAQARAESYLRDAAGNPVYAGTSLNLNGYNFNNIGASAFSSTSGVYNLAQEHVGQSVSLKSDLRGQWDWELVLSNFRFGLDTVRNPGTALPAAAVGGAGIVTALNGTGWSNVDLKGTWRPHGVKGDHHVSFGLHSDRARLVSNGYATTDWIAGPFGALTTQSLGKTDTDAVWLQDALRLAPEWKLTLGLRQEIWRAHDGVNFSAAPASNVVQPALGASKLSPKLALAWEPRGAWQDWRVSASYGKAWRFPTVTELYQAVTVAGVVYTPNPNLRPERAHSGELAIERFFEQGRVRVSLFQENLGDALISQNSTIPGTAAIGASVQNIDRIRARGLEVVADATDVGVRGLDLSASATWVDSRILADPNFRNAAGVLTNVTGKRTPNIPRLKLTGTASYRFDDKLSGMVALRYSDRVWATVDNTDINPNTWQGFDKFLVVDVRVNLRIDKDTRAAVGIDNLNNRRYFLFHPFPQRTLLAEIRRAF